MIETLHLQDFTVFRDVTLQFGALNVIHGENSTGKTHILKLAYSMVSSVVRGPNEPVGDTPTKTTLDTRLGSKLVGVYRPDKEKLGRLARRVQGAKRAIIKMTFGQEGALEFSFSTQSERTVKCERIPQSWLTQAPVFLPTRELLSVYPGFVSLYETQAIPFDEIWRDTCVLLGARVLRGPKTKEIQALLKPLEDAIDCKAEIIGDRFYVQMKNPAAQVEADMVAEGYRKLSMVARLIANGSLDDKGYLFWDEPEANLNPALIKHIAPLLLSLAEGGVQVFVATHSLFLLRELEIEHTKRSHKGSVQYIGLHTTNDGVTVSQGPTIDDSGELSALDQNLSQSERFLGLQ